MSDKTEKKNWFRRTGNFFREVSEIPGEVKEATDKIKEGKVSLSLDGLTELRSDLRRSVNLLVRAILSGLVFLGSSILIHASFLPVNGVVSLPGVIGIIFSSLFLFRILVYDLKN